MRKKNNKTNCQSRITRRQFLGTAASVTVFTIVPRHVLGGAGKSAPSEKLNIACIGVGGKGFDDVRNVMSESIVAICDVDTKHAAEAFKMFSEAKKYSDYRRMLDTEANNIDAVVVATPDHVHIPASVMAMRMGKHVYCEKPLGQNITEIRLATKVARQSGVATQMGNAAHTGYNYRSVAYSRLGDVESRDAVALECCEKFPDYLFGRVNYAQICLENGEVEKIPEIFDGKLDLKLLYPQRTMFHISEYVSFAGIIGLYYVKTGEQEAAKLLYKVLKKMDPRHQTTKRLKRALYPPLVIRLFLWLYRKSTGREFTLEERPKKHTHS